MGFDSASNSARNFGLRRSEPSWLLSDLGTRGRFGAVALLLAAAGSSFVAPAEATIVWEGKQVTVCTA
jgi:hypothetical protein